MLNKILYLFPGVSCQELPTFNVTSPVKAYPPCGMEYKSNDFWNMSGTMQIPDKTDFSNKIVITAAYLTVHILL